MKTLMKKMLVSLLPVLFIVPLAFLGRNLVSAQPDGRILCQNGIRISNPDTPRDTCQFRGTQPVTDPLIRNACINLATQNERLLCIESGGTYQGSNGNRVLCQNGVRIDNVDTPRDTCQFRGLQPVTDPVIRNACINLDTQDDRRLCIESGGTFQGSEEEEEEEEEEQDSVELESDCLSLDNCGIIDNIITITNILSAIVGLIVVIVIVVGGIQYTAARDNPQAVAAARERIMNALLALVFYLAMVAFLQWIVPGGIFSG